MKQAETDPITPRWIRPMEWEMITGMTIWQAYRELKRGNLRGVKKAGSWFIEFEELDAYFRRAEEAA